MQLVSVVIPTYNGQKYLRKAIESVLAQTYRYLEIIVVDDASTDNTSAILEEYTCRDPRLHVIRNKVNRRLPGALNIGFNRANGEYLTWTSDDNVMWPHAIERLVDVLSKNEDAALVYSDYELIDAEDRVLAGAGKNPISITDVNVVGPSFLYKRQAMSEVGDYREECLYYEDYEYWLRIAVRRRIVRHNETLYSYRLHNDSMTSHKPPDVEKGVLDAKRKYVRQIKWIPGRRKSDAYLRMMRSYYALHAIIPALECGALALLMRAIAYNMHD